MKQLPREPDRGSIHSARAKIHRIELKPRSLLGRALFGIIVGAMVIASFVFLSAFLAIGFAIVVLAVIIGSLRRLTSGKSSGETFTARSDSSDEPTIIDVERSAEDGVYRPRDNSRR